jgi:tape measure domain-containing protein
MADGNIDNLHFEVLLTDDKFRKRIAEDKKLAQDFNTELSRILDFKKDLGSGIKIVKSETKKDVKDVADGVKKVKDETAGAARSARTLTSEYRAQSGVLRELGSMAAAYFSVRGAERFLSSLVRITGEFEVQKKALGSMLGSDAIADNIFSQLRKNALESPYTLQELTKYAKQLTAFNISSDKLIETEKMLADVSAGLGVDMGRIILAYGQVKAAGALKGQELRQFTEAGVPLLQSLADQIGKVEGRAVALSEVFNKISKKEIPFEMVEQAFRDMTAEGGKFYNMQEVLVQTLQGKIGKLRDVWQQALYDIGNSNSSVLKGAVDFATMLAANLDKILKVLSPLVAGIGAYATIAAVAWSMSKVKAVAEFVRVITHLNAAIRLATSGMVGMQAASAALMGPIGKALAVVAALGVGIYELVKAFNKEGEAIGVVNQAMSDYQAYVATESSSAKDLFDKLKKLKVGTAEYKKVRDAILSNYGQYLSEVDKEKIKVGNLAGVYDNLKRSITEAAKAKFVAQGKESLAGEFNKNLGKITKRIGKIAKGDMDLYNELMEYVTGQKSLSDLSDAGRKAVSISDINDSPIGKGATHLKNDYDRAEKIMKEGEKQLEAVFKNSPVTSSTLSLPWSPNGWKEDKSATNAIENRISLLRTFKQAYDDLGKEGKSRSEAQELLLGIFGQDFAGLIKTEDFDKAITQSLEELAKIDPERYKAIALSLGKEGLAKAIADLKKASGTEHLSQGEIDRLAASAFKNATSALSLKGFRHKSVFSIREIIKELKGLTLNEGMLDADTLAKVKNGSVTLEELSKAFEKLRKGKFDEASGAFAERIKALAKGIDELGDALGKYGRASGNETLATLGEAISGMSDFASSVAQGFSSGGAIGAAIATVTYVSKVILEEMTYMEELKDKISDARLEKWVKEMEESLNGNGFFGESGLQKIRAAADVASQSLNKLQSATARLSASTQIKTVDRSGFANALGWMGGPLGILRTTGIARKYLDDQITTLGAAAAKLGYDLYDAYGNINADALQAILDTYDKLAKKDREWMTQAVAYANEYKAALDALDEVTKEIFGDVAAQAADIIVDSWASAGDAALDYADILDGVAKKYAKMLTQSVLLDSIFTEDFKNQLNAFVGNSDIAGAMALVQGGLDKAVSLAPALEQMLKPLEPYLNQQGSEGTSAGIKSITEDTANLLAAYINAIRADVALGNSQRGEILAILKEYVGLGSAPSYTEYLVKIEAHTANLASNTNDILSELRSIITPESGLPAVRVQNA